ncbi:DUF5654 family protein [Candidatus Parcubacteria bacterium]|nr:DUF5654 family protein [Candidatus Parcubacteria bacterium]
MAKNHKTQEFRERTLGYIMGALGLVVGLAWNDAITSLINKLFPVDRNGIILKFVYAALLTIVVIMVSWRLTRMMAEKDS